METKEQFYMAFINIHGLLRKEDLELGRDADTGGQTTYVLELAKALIKRPEVERLDIFTRLIFDPRVSNDYSCLVEEIEPGLNIIRMPCGPKRYLKKEALWPYLDEFADNILKFFQSGKRVPDILHSHYADAGYVGVRLSSLLSLPFAFTGHSLGRVKKMRLEEKGLKNETIEKTFRISRRIEAEEMVLDSASFIVTSTNQEVEEQYSLYDKYQPKRMIVIQPGVNLDRFSPPHRFRFFQPEYFKEITRFLKHPKKPMILALSRADARKNIVSLIHAYGSSEELQEIANLIIFAGSRKDINKADKEAREVYRELLRYIDYYDLYGKVAYPKKHASEDVPNIYRIAAGSQGVFVNPALTEPFGLTLIEAAASGLPIVATKDGGPKDIIAACNNGLLIDPLDVEDIKEKLLVALKDGNQWRNWAKSGIKGAFKHFSWEGHAQKYIKVVKKVVVQNKRRFLPRQFGRNIALSDRVLISDIDNTLVGNDEALNELLNKLKGAQCKVGIGVATGRSLPLTLAVLKKNKIPVPNILITSVGSEIYYGPKLVQDVGWTNHINYRWKPLDIKKKLNNIKGISMQAAEGQGNHKISFNVDAQIAPTPKEITSFLRKAGIYANVIYSHEAYLDILPIRASKGLAVRYCAVKWGIPIDRFLVAGDSGNDEEMLRGNTLGVVVGNYSPELEHLRKDSNVLFAKGHFAFGILEAIDHYKFLGKL
ncbi:MAG: HAD-IIB family hydrolase [Nitrospinae bacterium]|nr:HAD-IIB family hydrolase [Nitrospinota bacterium]